MSNNILRFKKDGKYVPVDVNAENVLLKNQDGEYTGENLEDLLGEYHNLEQNYTPRLNMLEATDQNITAQLAETGISYAQFGAKLDGITDDTEAIRATHNYANEHGLPVVVRNARFVLNGEVEVQTDVDLSSCELITTWQDEAEIEYDRTSNLFKLTGDETIDITSQVNQSEFKKGATTIPSLKNVGSGTVIISTTDIDIYRDIFSSPVGMYKQEANILNQNNDGTLHYPLTKDYTTSPNFKVILKPKKTKRTFKLPKIILDNAKIYGVIDCHINNIEVCEGVIEELNTSETIAPLHTVAEFRNCSGVVINNINAPIIGRRVRTGENGLGYLLLFVRVADIRINKVVQEKGWSGINGNWFRDIIVTNSTALNIGAHAGMYDMKVKDSTIIKRAAAQGGGLWEFDGCTFISGTDSGCVMTRSDYGGDFDGTIRIKNSEAINAEYIVYLYQLKYDAGRKVVVPNVEIDNVTMHNNQNVDTKGVYWGGFAGNWEADAPNFYLRNIKSLNETASHTIIALPNRLTNPFMRGTVNVEIENCKQPKTTYSGKENIGSASVILSNITVKNTNINVSARNSVINLGLHGTSNITVRLESCQLVFIVGANSDSATTVWEPSTLSITNSEIEYLHTNLRSVPAGRIKLILVGNVYRPYRNIYGSILTGNVGLHLWTLVSYAKDNRAEIGVSMDTMSDRLFNYVDTNHWIVSK